jgi:mRNA-degrading endonuclease toxin of MazEF toxin-antitoxin module
MISFADFKRFTQLLGTVPDSTMEQIDMALRATLNLQGRPNPSTAN